MLDLSAGPVGGVATMVLSDFGAELIKVEPPGGDPGRALAASPWWLRGKRSVTLDLVRDADRARLLGLVDGADVVVTSFRPGEAEGLGADYATLSGRRPDLIYCSVTGWGPEGAYADYPVDEGLVAAKSGRTISFSGQRKREGPAFAAVRVGSHAASQGAVQGIVAALWRRESTGEGALVETSLLQGLMPYDLLRMTLSQLAEKNPELFAGLTLLTPGMPTLNYHPLLAGDGRWMQMGNLLEHLFIAFLQATDLTEMLMEERFQGQPATWEPEAIEIARDRILTRMQERPAAEWMEIFRANGNVAAEPYTTAQEALGHPDMIANGDIVDVAHPRLGTVRQLGPIAQLSATPGRVGAPGSEAGADTEEILSAIGQDSSREVGSPAAETVKGMPLAGVTILEFATIIATPLATSMLADLGARVIKVEPVGGDPYRGMGPAGVMAAKTNAGKESICIDLKSTEGQAIVADLIRGADAIVHNYRPGVPERLGIDYETARALRPDIVWVSANGYGPDAPSARRPSAHPVPGAVCGGALQQAGAGTPPDGCESLEEVRETARQLMRANEANPDPNTSVIVASATLLALLARRRFGIGQQVFANMLTANAYANGEDFLSYEGKAARAVVDVDLYGTGPCHRLYPAADASWVFVAIEAQWPAFCEAVGRSDLAEDARFTSPELRTANAEALVAELSALFLTRQADDWERLLISAGVGCVRADGSTVGDFWANDEHVRLNGFAPESEHARMGSMRRWGPLVRVDGGASHYGPGVLAGEQTEALLEEAGRTMEEIATLRESGVVWAEPQ